MGIIILLIALFIFMVLYAKFIVDKSINKAWKKWVIPYLKEQNMDVVRIERIPYQFLPFFKNKGDFNNAPLAPWDDTNINRKIYFYVHYKDSVGNKYRSTVKVSNNFWSHPIKIEFYPKIPSKLKQVHQSSKQI